MLEPQRRDAGDDANRCGPGLPMRSRTTVGQAVGAFDLIRGDPLAHGARTNARGGGDEVPWQMVVEYAGDQFGSTRGGGSGILVDVYLVLRNETVALFTISFSRRDRVDNLWGRPGTASPWAGSVERSQLDAWWAALGISIATYPQWLP